MLVAFAFQGPAPQAVPPEILSRISEEAAVFQQNMPKALTQESLEQRAALPPSRFRPRIGSAATTPLKPRLQVREIVSEYRWAPSKNPSLLTWSSSARSSRWMAGHVQTAEHARHALSLGIQSQDDRLRKRMLEDFAKNGLVDVATDYGLILLAFTRRGMASMEINPAGDARVGAESARVFAWRQTSDAGGELEFHGRFSARRALQGALWVRSSDGLPLRIEAWVEYVDRGHHPIRDQATVEYVMLSHGFLTPASVVHRHFVDNQSRHRKSISLRSIGSSAPMPRSSSRRFRRRPRLSRNEAVEGRLPFGSYVPFGANAIAVTGCSSHNVAAFIPFFPRGGSPTCESS